MALRRRTWVNTFGVNNVKGILISEVITTTALDCSFHSSFSDRNLTSCIGTSTMF